LGRLLELKADGTWKVIKTGVQLGMLGNQRVALTGDEIKALTAPLTYPSDPRPNPPLFTPMPSSDERLGELPGFEGTAPAGPTISTTPIQWQSWEDLLIERNAAEQKRFRGWLVDEARRIEPNFDPTGYDAHHMIALKEYPELNVLRIKLAELDVDINDPAINGVLLPRGKEAPGTTPHGDTQSNPEYWRETLERFRYVETREDAITVLKKIRTDLLDGKFVEPKPRGP
jgi:A nuclease family of the HNH/ENDO VII superfamily with conserved AHH